MGALCLSPWCRVDLSVGLSASIGARRSVTAGSRRRAGRRGRAGGERGVKVSEKLNVRNHTARQTAQRNGGCGEKEHTGARISVSKSPLRVTSTWVPSQGQKYVMVTGGRGEANPRKHNQRQHTRTARSSQDGDRGGRDGHGWARLTLVSDRVERRVERVEWRATAGVRWWAGVRGVGEWARGWEERASGQVE